ncbi:alpha/beta fold hydrolase [Actinoplanes sp. GCM10030250]|uniref:alpha/beta fold hydrolase n=1 Tax=Actinoplanes sp. GCM10030250 TaxID=3273376 RepID=UPI00360FC0E6
MPNRTYVLVPGAGGSTFSWQRVIPLLREQGHDATAVELPAADDKAGLQEYADAIVTAATGLDDVVLVAHSMGGLSAPLTCDGLPVSAIVLLNAMIPLPGETGGDWWEVTRQEQARRDLDRREGRDPDGPFDLEVYFLHDLPAPLAAEALATEQPQSGTPFTEPWPLPAWPDVPTHVLAGAEERFFPVDFQERVARERLGLAPRIVPGGHLAALSHPAELVAEILAVTGR